MTYDLYARRKTTGWQLVAWNLPLNEAATCADLNAHDVEWAIEEHGRCDCIVAGLSAALVAATDSPSNYEEPTT